ncbi:MAG: hypothetical protein ACKVOO_12530 [Burkholderiaceae bacterium]
MPRQSTPPAERREAPINEAALIESTAAANQLAAITRDQDLQVLTVAQKLGYEGALTIGGIEDEIRFYQRRTVEAILETGKRLLLLKELTPHGEFNQRVEMLGFSKGTAWRFMSAAEKTAKSSNLKLLASQAKNGSAFLELITHDDDVIENLSVLDNFDRMSASQLRAAAREMQAEKLATDQLLADKNAKFDKLSRRISKQKPDEVLLDLQKESTALMNDALGCIRGQLRASLIALKNHGTDDNSLFMAGLVGQVQADLTALRDEFNLPDISSAAEAQLAAEVAQWAGN